MIRTQRVVRWLVQSAVGVWLAGSVCMLRQSPTSPIRRQDIVEINPESFWFYPWGGPRAHRGIDIFASRGTAVTAPVPGVVLFARYGSVAGNYAYILGPGWRTYYFAHMDTVFVAPLNVVFGGDTIGLVGATGNAVGKPPHLHYSICSLWPLIWQYNPYEAEPWARTFYLDPTKRLGFRIALDSETGLFH